MTLKTSTIPKKYVFVQATTPTDLTEGRLWYNTTDKTTYASDGTSYTKIANVDMTSVYKMIGNNALNIIDNTAQASLTAGTNASIIRDIYSNSNGYLNSVDTTNTTAGFNTNLYKNNLLIAASTQTYTQTSTLTKTEGSFSIDFPIAKPNSYLSSFDCLEALTGGASWVVNIKNGSTILATKSISAVHGWNTVTFLDTDYSSLFQIGDTLTLELTSTGNPRLASVTSSIPAGVISAGNYLVPNYDVGYNLVFKNNASASPPTNTIVQTNAQTLSTTPTKALIVSTNETTAGTGTITYDLSTDGGTNWQTGLTSNTEITLTNAGTSLILKQNLNGVGAGNTASATDYGVVLY